jgi:pantoate--beta-alanine ligase
VSPAVRESDGLAMSSRNVYLGAEDRIRALALSRSLAAVEAAWRGGTRDGRALERAGLAVMAQEPSIVVDYLAVADPNTLQPATVAERGAIVMTAARVGRTRLIDNIILGEGGSTLPHGALQSGESRG